MYGFIAYIVTMVVIVTGFYVLSVCISPNHPNPVKNDTYECGFPASKPIITNVNFQYYFYAIIFIIMDIASIGFMLYAIGDQPVREGIIYACFGSLLVVPILYVMSGGKNDT